ncbi:TlpA disulfide reductase family protein [Anaerolineales bacterium HSG6]|nr:TlpA disulfide reductase family protein [Anaerolineales bacterium HSG6]MDM8531173.1 TlpA disulfide reductase family protein [Anaerolineales bacterium HSG25]
MTQTTTQPKQATFDKNIVLIIGLLLLVGLIVISAINLQNIESTDLNGQVASDFTLPLFDQFEGESITLSDLRGQVVVVNFWASWCVECYKEADLLEQIWRDYKDKGVIFIGVDHLDTEKPALEYIERYNITYPNGPDLGDKISQEYAITGVPETFFIDKEGNIAHVQIGPIKHHSLITLLDKLVAQ